MLEVIELTSSIIKIRNKTITLILKLAKKFLNIYIGFFGI